MSIKCRVRDLEQKLGAPGLPDQVTIKVTQDGGLWLDPEGKELSYSQREQVAAAVGKISVEVV